MAKKKTRTRSQIGKGSRNKGVVGERQLAKKLNEWVLPNGTPVHAERNARNGISTTDLAHNIPGWHIEVKRVEGMKLGSKKLADAEQQSFMELLGKGDGDWCVMYRQNCEPWKVSIHAEWICTDNNPALCDDSIVMLLNTFMKWIGCTHNGERLTTRKR